MDRQVGCSPQGLPRATLDMLKDCAERGACVPLDELRSLSESHLDKVKLSAKASPLLNVRVAEAVAGAIREVLSAWDGLTAVSALKG